MLTSDWLAADWRGGHLPELHGVGAAGDPRLPRRHPHPALLGPLVTSHWWSLGHVTIILLSDWLQGSLLRVHADVRPVSALHR